MLGLDPGIHQSSQDALSRSRWIAGSFSTKTRFALYPGNDSSPSDLLDLSELQFDGRGAAEDRDCDLHARARLVDFLDHTGERRERSVRHAHILADLERHRRLRPFHAFLHLV